MLRRMLRFSALPILVTGLFACMVPTNAVKADQSEQAMAQLVFKNSPDPADGFAGSGRPISRSSGGSRGTCDGQLVALLPSSETLSVSDAGCNLPSTADLALTLSTMPIVWVHVPALESPAHGELALLDENQQAVIVQSFPLSGTAGIVGLPIGETLEVDHTYYWVFTILETGVSRSENAWVEGALRRVDPDADLVMALNGADNRRDQITIWAQQGVWHEALTALVELRQAEPANAAIGQDWQDFLESVGLGAIANAPLQNCCY